LICLTFFGDHCANHFDRIFFKIFSNLYMKMYSALHLSALAVHRF
jgi:hypothetical protein